MQVLIGKTRELKEKRNELSQEWILLCKENLEILFEQCIDIISTPERENRLLLLKVEKNCSYREFNIFP